MARFSWTGDLTIHGITQHMTIPVKLRQAAQDGGPSGSVFESTFEIDRTEFGIVGVPKTGASTYQSRRRYGSISRSRRLRGADQGSAAAPPVPPTLMNASTVRAILLESLHVGSTPAGGGRGREDPLDLREPVEQGLLVPHRLAATRATSAANRCDSSGVDCTRRASAARGD
jgi:hypothetical protein